MKSPSLTVLALAFLSAPFFVGAADPTLNGGGGCGCSDANQELTGVSSGDAVTGDPTAGNGTVVPTDTASDSTGDDTSGTGPNGDDGAVDVCEIPNASGSVVTKDWSQDITSFVGLPVSDACQAECGGTGDHSPWSLSVHLKGSLLSEPRSYSFGILKDEFKDKIRYLEAKRDTADPDGCPAEEQDPCWRTCTEGECLPAEVPLKDEETLQKEAKAIALDYFNNVCKLELKAEDLDADDWNDRLKAAFQKISLTDTLQCAEGLAMTATQAAPTVEKMLKAGLVRDEKGEVYTADQLFKCLRKSMFK